MSHLDAVATTSPDPDGSIRSLFEQHVGMVRHSLRSVLRRSSNEDDLVQEVFIRLMMRLRQSGELNVPAWLNRVARNVAVDEVRRSRPIPVEDAQLDAAVHPDPDLALIGDELVQRINAGLRDMPARQRTALLLHASGDRLSGAALAKAMGTTADAAESLLARARANMKRHLGALEAA